MEKLNEVGMFAKCSYCNGEGGWTYFAYGVEVLQWDRCSVCNGTGKVIKNIGNLETIAYREPTNASN
jgi:DnaJ-class molecular chaperone